MNTPQMLVKNLPVTFVRSKATHNLQAIQGLGFGVYARFEVLHQGGAFLISRGDLQTQNPKRSTLKVRQVMSCCHLLQRHTQENKRGKDHVNSQV